MSQVSTERRTSSLPGAAIVRRIRRLLIVALAGLLLYSTFATASRSTCTDDVMPSCMQIDLRPSPIIVAAVVGMLLWALTRVLHRADDEAAALRILDRTAAVMAVLLAVAAVVSQVWMWSVPLETWSGTGWFVLPFPFGAVELTTY